MSMSLHSGLNKLRLSALLMVLTILLIAAFQGYWIKKLYGEEWFDLKRETDITFRDVSYKLQMHQFGKDTLIVSKGAPDNLFFFHMLDSLKYRVTDSTRGGRDNNAHFNISVQAMLKNDSGHPHPPPDAHSLQSFSRVIRDALPGGSNLPVIMKFSLLGDSSGTPLSVYELDSAYKKDLLRLNITVPYTIVRTQGNGPELDKPIPPDMLESGFLLIGRSKTYAYRVTFGNPTAYILGRLRLPIVISALLLIFTTASFVFLYRNLVRQRQIAAIKNEFISNMTHELKTPISTVTVAVEALRHFGALEDPEKTREYLDISALELQRLSLLVDKVLKLSLFENRQIELKPERVDLPALTAEVMASMRLSLEKAGAVVHLTSSGEGLFVRGDRMHLGSVISNLLDNALKYSRASPALAIDLSREGEVVLLSVADNGIGIPAAYREKIFEKFFRVPSGDVHNIKGYGLGLSYVQHIVTRHEGRISVESREGKGSTFIIQLPAA
jgi:two-component system phosphate regulon sensor histidine kinase PhoR